MCPCAHVPMCPCAYVQILFVSAKFGVLSVKNDFNKFRIILKHASTQAHKHQNLQMITLISGDEVAVEVSVEAAKWSKTLSDLVEDCDNVEGVPIPVPNVDGEALKEIVIYLEYAVHHPELKDFGKVDVKISEEINVWLTQYLTNKPLPPFHDPKKHSALIERVVIASDYFDIPSLTEICCKHMAAAIRTWRKNAHDKYRTWVRENVPEARRCEEETTPDVRSLVSDNETESDSEQDADSDNDEDDDEIDEDDEVEEPEEEAAPAAV
jgi:hypothetical protein